jgi:hypothetical protein
VFRFSVTGTRMVRRMRATTRGRRTCAQLVMDQNTYEEERASAARSRRAAARALLERAADEPTEAHRDQWIEQARRKLQQASGPLPRRRQGLEHREDIVMRLCGGPPYLCASVSQGTARCTTAMKRAGSSAETAAISAQQGGSRSVKRKPLATVPAHVVADSRIVTAVTT